MAISAIRKFLLGLLNPANCRNFAGIKKTSYGTSGRPDDAFQYNQYETARLLRLARRVVRRYEYQ